MPPQPGVKLPKWAKLMRPHNNNQKKKQKQSASKSSSTTTTPKMTKRRQPLTIRQEEIYLRKRCYHILSQALDDTMDHVLEESLASSLDRIQDFLDAAAPKLSAAIAADTLEKGFPISATAETPQPTTMKRQRLLSTSSLTSPESARHLDHPQQILLDQQQEAHNSHDPLLLPIIVLEGPPFGLDRKAYSKCITRSLRNQRPRSVIVNVTAPFSSSSHHRQRTGGGVGKVSTSTNNGNTNSNSGGGSSSSRYGDALESNNNNNNNWMMPELVRACHAQVPVLNSIESLQRRILKRKRKKACTYSDLLLLWAQHVTEYDEIVVVLDVR